MPGSGRPRVSPQLDRAQPHGFDGHLAQEPADELCGAVQRDLDVLHDPLAGQPVSVVWPVNFVCPLGQLGYSVSFSGGNSGSPAARWMNDALNEHLSYNLYQDAAHTIVWGDGSAGTQPYVGRGSANTNYTIDVYAYLPGGQTNVSAFQTFSDGIVATITF